MEQAGHYNSDASALQAIQSSEDQRLAAKSTTALSGYPLSAGDIYGPGAGSGIQYYCNYPWTQTANGATSDHFNKNMLLQYGSQHTHFYPMYPTSVITSTFGADVCPGDVSHSGSALGMDARYQHSCILELRKEKSRDAARSRRGKENYEFYELAKMLPLPGAITSQLDKASIIRLTISFLKLRDFSSHGDPPWQRDGPAGGKSNKATPSRRRNLPSLSTEIFETHQGTHILQSLDGFVFTLSNDGRFLYISETVSIYLGLSQVEMTGSSIFDYVHNQDHQELAEQLGLNSQGIYSNTGPSGSSDDSNNSTTSRAVTPTLPERTSVMNPNPSKGYDRCFCIRMKSTLTKRGVHVKSSGYRVVQVLAHMRPQFSFSLARKHPPPLLGLVAMAIALPPPTLTELVIDNDMFVTRLSPELKVTYCEPRISDMMDINADDLTNKNMYDYCHAEDLQKLRKAHVDLLSKGQVLTDYYRLMNKHGGYVWIQTCATVICNAKNAEEQNIIAINYVLSGIEYAGCVMNTNQLKVVSKTDPDQSDHSENEPGSDRDEKLDKDDWSISHRDKHSDDGHSRHGNRKKPSAQDDVGVADVTSLEARSPVNSFDLLYQKHKNLAKESQAAVNGVLLNSDLHKPLGLLEKSRPNNNNNSATTTTANNNNNSNDPKNSRRKMDKPRKRKRDQMEAEVDGKSESVGGLSAVDELTPVNPVNGTDLNGMATDSTVLVAPSASGSRPASTHSPPVAPTSPVLPSDGSLRQHAPSSPSPEDLSIRQSQSPLVAIPDSPRAMNGSCSSSNNHSNNNNNGHTATNSSTTSTSTTSGNDDLHQSWVGGSSLADIATSSGSSVRDLEEAMNKHLPSLPVTDGDHIRASLAAAAAADYNHQSMLGLHQTQPPHQHHQHGQKHHKSTIQWIGSPGQHGSGSDGLPATNLLRSLYVNRESVIRPNIYNPRAQYYPSTEHVQNTLLTPPGGATDPYKDSFSSTVAAAAGMSQAAKDCSPAVTSSGYQQQQTPGGLLSSCYSGSPPTMASANLSDAYTMTPPSSVSPQDKYASPFSSSGGDHPHPHHGHQFHPDVGMTSATLRGYDGSLPMPIKPQAYPLPAHATSHVTGYDRSGQYASPAGYYGGPGFGSYGHGGSPTPAHYRDTRANNVW